MEDTSVWRFAGSDPAGWRGCSESLCFGKRKPTDIRPNNGPLEHLEPAARQARQKGFPHAGDGFRWFQLGTRIFARGGKIVFLSDRLGTMEVWSCKGAGYDGVRFTELDEAAGHRPPRVPADAQRRD